MTGITSAVGSWLAAEALHRNFRILALVRDENIETAKERVRQALIISDAGEHFDKVDVIKGDISSSLADIAGNSKITDVSMVLHCAASTDFSDNYADQSLSANVDGTGNILELTKELNVPLCYISTAYIAGKREGVVKENETDLGQEFNNVYEKTKCAAEQLVHS